MDAGSALDEALSAYGEVVWSWRRDAGAKLAEQSVSDGDNKPAHRGEHEVSRKAIAQGMSECSPLTCMLVCALFCATGTRDRGCSAHPAFPAPSVLKRGDEIERLGQNMPRDCKTASGSIAACNSFHGKAELGR